MAYEIGIIGSANTCCWRYQKELIEEAHPIVINMDELIVDPMPLIGKTNLDAGASHEV